MDTPNSERLPLAVSDGGPITAPDRAFAGLPAVLEHAAVAGLGKRITFIRPAGEPLVWSYPELLEHAERICGGLRHAGLVAGARVVLLLEPAEAVLPAFWGCLLGGFVPLVMEVPASIERNNPAFDRVCRVSEMLAGRAAGVLVVVEPERVPIAEAVAAELPAAGVRVASLAGLVGAEPDPRHHRPVLDELAFLCFSSGSTGIPKCIMLTHRCVILRNAGVNQHNDHRSDDVNLNWLPFDHIGSITEHIRSMQLGCALVYVGKDRLLEQPLRLLDVIDRHRVTHTWGPNFSYALVHDALASVGPQRTWDLSCVRFLISGGEAASHGMMQGFLERTRAFGFPATGFRPSFGMVEVSAGVTYHVPSEAAPLGFVWLARAGGSGEPIEQVAPGGPAAKPYARLGRPLPGCALRVVDQRGVVLPEGTVGRVQFTGAALTAGYLDNPALTEQVFLADGWLETEDLGFLLDGELVLTGRTKEMLVVNGVNYYSRELEDIVESLAGVEVSFTAACAVKGAASETEQLAIFLCPTDHDPSSVTRLVRRVREALVRRARANPSFIVPLETAAIPKTPIGKIQRLELARRFERGDFAVGLAAGERAGVMVPPRTPLERLLAEIWQGVLELDVGVHDNFFAVGGDSIKAVMVVTQLHGRIPGAPTVSLFDAPTIAELAGVLEQNMHAPFTALDGSVMSEGSLDRFTVVSDPASRHLPFPLTEIQQAYWAGRNPVFELGGRSVHAYTEIEGVGLALPRLERAWQRMIERHEALRTIILPDGTQRVLETVPAYPIVVDDLCDLDPAARAARLDELRRARSHRVLPCEDWPTFELRAARLDDGRWRVYMSFDALFFDARSQYILLAEFRRFYRDPDVVLEPLALSFRDYVQQGQAIARSESFEQARRYWLERIDALPGPPELPLATHPRSLHVPRFVQLAHMLPEPTWQRLERLATRAGVTPSCLLLTVFADALRPWSRSDRFVLNVTTYRRLPLHPQVNDVIGDFSSLSLLAVEAPGETDFVTRARALQRQLLRDLAHAAWSGVEVLRELARRRGEATGALAPVVFTAVLGDEMHARDERPFAWLGDVVWSVTQTAQIWFDHIAFEEGGSLVCRWNVVEGLFPPGVPEAIFAAYLAHLRRLAEDEGAWHVPWVETRRGLVPSTQLESHARVNHTAVELPPGLLHSGFFAMADAQPEAVAVIAPDRTLDYHTLASLAQRVGHWLRRAGVEPERLVAVAMEKGWEQVVAVLGVLAAGAAYLPIDPGLPAPRLLELLTLGGARIVLTQAHVRPLLRVPDGVEVICIDDPDVQAQSSAPLEPRQHGSDLAYVIFTSGSSGAPKGVMIDHRGAVNTIADINRRFAVGPSDRVLALSALSFDLSVYDIFGVLAAGGAIVIPRPSDVHEPARWARLVADHHVSVWNTVPAFMNVLMDHVEGERAALLASLRLVMMSGDWIPLRLPERVRALPGRPAVISLGGATEASIWSILHPIDTVEPQWTSIPYGRPMANQSVHVLDDALAPCPDWVPGMLHIGGVGVALGYLGDTERTDQSFVRHPQTGERLYRTGDLARFVPTAAGLPHIELLGREDDQVKIQGFRVELGEIEVALARHPDVESAVVVALGERHAGKQLVAYVVPRRELPELPERLGRHLKGLLPAYMVPARYVALERLPLSSNGKVDRKRLPAPIGPAPGREREAAARPTAKLATARAIAEIVAEVLGLPTVGIDDELLALGATSIEIMRIVNQIDKQYGRRVSYELVFANPSITAIAAAVGVDPEAEPLARTALELPAELLDRYRAVCDPDERDAFVAAAPGLRRLDCGDHEVGSLVALPTALSHAITKLRDERRSHRSFSPHALPLSDLAELLACLRRLDVQGKPKYLYGSASGLYPVQTYLYVKPGRVAGLDGGYFHHDPAAHRLVRLSSALELDETIYDVPINRPVWRRAAFAIYLVAQLAAIVPMYRESSLQFAVIEAGLMAQLLEQHAPHAGLGLCQMGQVDLTRIRGELALDEGHVLVHSLMGGAPLPLDTLEPATRPLDRVEEEL
jgi:amino acid adenylation domain-containing protein